MSERKKTCVKVKHNLEGTMPCHNELAVEWGPFDNESSSTIKKSAPIIEIN